MIGIVKSYRTKNGCGFIYSIFGDVFVHASHILENAGAPSDILVIGEEVEYDLVEGRRGYSAENVRRISPPVLFEFTGIVKKYLSHEGYGFIETDKEDVFFHCSDFLHHTIVLGDAVAYLKVIYNNAPRAVRIIKIPHV